jgi:hypothetical protein
MDHSCSAASALKVACRDGINGTGWVLFMRLINLRQHSINGAVVCDGCVNAWKASVVWVEFMYFFFINSIII